MRFNELMKDIYHLYTARKEMGFKITSLVVKSLMTYKLQYV